MTAPNHPFPKTRQRRNVSIDRLGLQVATGFHSHDKSPGSSTVYFTDKCDSRCIGTEGIEGDAMLIEGLLLDRFPGLIDPNLEKRRQYGGISYDETMKG